MRKWLIVGIAGVLVGATVIILLNWRTGARPDLGTGPVAGSYLTEPTTEEQSQQCEGVTRNLPVVRFTEPPRIDGATLCVPDPADQDADVWRGPLVPRTVRAGDSGEVDAALRDFATAWAGPDDLPFRWSRVACTGDFRLNPSFAVSIDGTSVRPVAPYNACRRPTESADAAFLRLSRVT